MKKYENPSKNTWNEILKRPLFDVSELYGKVQNILNEIKTEGDQALKKFTFQFDGIELDELAVSTDE